MPWCGYTVIIIVIVFGVNRTAHAGLVPYTWPLAILPGSVLVTSFSDLTFPRLWIPKPLLSLSLSLLFYLSCLSLWTPSINWTPVKQISTFSPAPFLSTEGVMTSFVRQINCIHPSFSSAEYVASLFLFFQTHIVQGSGLFLPFSIYP